MNSTSEVARRGRRQRTPEQTQAMVAKTLARRYWAERRFRLLGILAVLTGVAFVGFLLVSIVGQGYTAFSQAYVTLDVFYDPAVIDPGGTRRSEDLAGADYAALAKAALRSEFPEVKSRQDRRGLNELLSDSAGSVLERRIAAEPTLIGRHESVRLLTSDKADLVLKGKIDRSLPEAERGVNDLQLAWIDKLRASGRMRLGFNRAFLTQGDSRQAEQAGIWGATVGSMFTLAITLLLSFPIGVAAAVYLEEFAPRNRMTDLIEVNINNLAAVPSIVFGLLGLAVFIGFFGMPRSAPLVGGLVLTLLTLPTIIITARAALKAVPPSIREAALGMGASKIQTVAHHVLPLAMPGVLTGTIIGMARALGESAPLLMIGMVAFIVEVPKRLTDPSTVMPVQIFLWSSSPERAFVERTSGAIMVLLAFLLVMNASAVILRNRFERRW